MSVPGVERLDLPPQLSAGVQAIVSAYTDAQTALASAQAQAARAGALAAEVQQLTDRLAAVAGSAPGLGASVDYANNTAQANWAALCSALGSPLSWYRWFGNPVPALTNFPAGTKLIVSAKPAFPSPTADDTKALQALAAAASQASPMPHLTVQHEPDNAAKKLSPSAYASCFEASRSAVKAVSRDVKFGPIIQSWTVTHRDKGDSPWLRALDPDRVDWVGIDVYPNDNETTEAAAAPVIALAQKLFGSDIPILIPEWGYPSTAPNRARQISDGWAYLSSVPNVRAVLYYHYDRWALSAADGTMAAYAAIARQCAAVTG